MATYANGVPVSKLRRAKKPAYTAPPVRRVQAESPAWYGVVIVVLLLLAVAWIVAYTLGPAPLQASLGGWNYVIAIALAIGGVVLLTRWR